MSSTVMLLLCALFVFYMLRLDHKQSIGVSRVSWLPTVWFLVLSSKPVSFWLQSTGGSMEEGNPLDRQFLLVMFGLGLIVLLRRRLDWGDVVRKNGWLAVFLGYTLLSCLWADAPFLSFKRWTRSLIALVMICVVASESRPWAAVESLLRRSVYILIPLSYVLIHYFADYGRLYIHHSGDLMWIGATGHKNQLTQLCLFAIFFLVWTFFRRRKGLAPPVPKHHTGLEVAIIGIALTMMGGPDHRLTYSATTVGAGIIGLGLLVLLFRRPKGAAPPAFALLAGLVVFIMVYGTITPMLGKLALFDVSSAMGREEHLTGRSDVWAQLVPVALKSPLLGHGYEGFWSTAARDGFDIPHAHNGFLDLILSLGFVGLGLYALLMVAIVRTAHNLLLHHFEWGVFLICYLIIMLLSNITETLAISLESRMLVVILCLNIAFSKKSAQAGV